MGDDISKEQLYHANLILSTVMYSELHEMYLGKGGRARSHKNLSNSVVESGERFVVDAQEALSRSLLGHLVLQVPYSISMCELLIWAAALR